MITKRAGSAILYLIQNLAIDMRTKKGGRKGAEDAPPVLLLHASGVAGWSWKFNAEELSKKYRIYAVDLIGDAGKSKFSSMDHIMKTGQDQAELYAAISDKLGVDKAYGAAAVKGGTATELTGAGALCVW